MGDIIKSIAIGTITVIIGGTAYTISQSDIVKNFADDMGLTQEQAGQYISEIPEEQLVETWTEVASNEINFGQALLNTANEIDCVNYEYSWESFVLSCAEGKKQMTKIAKDSIALGESYERLDSDSASMDDVRETIRLIDQLNASYQLEIVSAALTWSEVDEMRKINSYNKAILKAVLESD